MVRLSTGDVTFVRDAPSAKIEIEKPVDGWIPVKSVNIRTSGTGNRTFQLLSFSDRSEAPLTSKFEVLSKVTTYGR